MDTFDEPPMLDPLDGEGAPVTADVMRRMLGRHRRRQWRLLGAVTAVVLAAGATAGFAIGSSGNGGTNLTTGQPAASPVPNAASVFAGAGSPGNVAVSTNSGPMPATQLLLRNATDGTRVRLYSLDIAAKCATGSSASGSSSTTVASPSPCPPPCAPTSILSAEVSDDQVAGVLPGPVWQTPGATGFSPVAAAVVGNGEPQPILVVLAHAGSDVATVQLTTAYGSDVETPTGGWVALALRLPSAFTPASPDTGVPAGTVTARSATGATVFSGGLTEQGPGKMTAGCAAGPPCLATTASSTTSTTAVAGCACAGQAPVTAPPGDSAAATKLQIACASSGPVTRAATGGASGSASSASSSVVTTP